MPSFLPLVVRYNIRDASTPVARRRGALPIIVSASVRDAGASFACVKV